MSNKTTAGPEGMQTDGIFYTGSDTENGKARVSTSDKIRAKDINELRAKIEALYSHTHSYEDASGGGGTTTCG